MQDLTTHLVKSMLMQQDLRIQDLTPEKTGPNLSEAGYQVTVPEAGWTQDFAYLDGNLVRLVPEQQQRKSQQRLVIVAALTGAGTVSVKPQYWVSSRRLLVGCQLECRDDSGKTAISVSL